MKSVSLTTVPEGSLLWTGLGMALVLQLAGAGESVFGNRSPAEIVDRTRGLLVALMPISVAFSVLLRFSRSNRTRLALLSFRFLLMFVISYAAGQNILVPLLFVMSVVSECVFYLELRFAIVASLAAVATVTLSRGTVSAWNVILPAARPLEIALLAVTAFTFGTFGILFRVYYEMSHRRQESIHMLDRTVDALSSANKGFQRYALDAELRAAEAERNRIVRELHDSIGYTLTNIVVMSRVAQRLGAPQENDLTELLQTICSQAQSGLTEMRSTLRILRAAEPNRPRGIDAIRQLAATFQLSTGVEVRVEATNVRWDPDGPLDASIFRIVQESLTNSFRHGHARKVLLQFWQDHAGLSLNVEDDGRSSVDGPIGLGLSGMEERVRELGGTVSARGSRYGFSVRAWFPALNSGDGA
ncbi:MAG TPA: sensor histidine kinase [Spirochaetia bacterium]|nr:sensor histidine kinase [Spirochaetia bacterium]